jgi:ornithine carbamoyltransferase
VKVAYLGDGNNVCHSLMVACAKLGANFVAGVPEGYDPDETVVGWAQAAAEASGATVSVVHDASEAARSADVLYTDVWTSMGQDEERDKRLRDLAGFGIDDRMVALASHRAIVMHCLPAHYGEEVTEAVLHGPRSAAWDQAENRLHAQKALMALVIK